ncbi:MAG: hypothetical protein O6948_08380 [Deltaproteobacteria bacterium]|jgi:hypothetical protein|nr:hypothetical protein [Deltaproteobacteria bacterium]
MGNTVLSGGKRHSRRGNTPMGQRGSRHMAGIGGTRGGTQSPSYHGMIHSMPSQRVDRYREGSMRASA